MLCETYKVPGQGSILLDYSCSKLLGCSLLGSLLAGLLSDLLSYLLGGGLLADLLGSCLLCDLGDVGSC